MTNLTDTQIKNWLLMFGVSGRFNGDIEFIDLVYKDVKSEADVERMITLLKTPGVNIDFQLRAKIEIPKNLLSGSRRPSDCR